ncbi:phosphopantetheine-binding protein [Streptomyces sp. M10(2022)]
MSDVGIDDGFVALGGDSIIAMQLVSRARKAGLRITVGDVLTRRDMEALAQTATTLDREPAPVADSGWDRSSPLPSCTGSGNAAERSTPTTSSRSCARRQG